MNTEQYYRGCNRVALVYMEEWGIISRAVYNAGLSANGFETDEERWARWEAEEAEEMPDFSRN